MEPPRHGSSGSEQQQRKRHEKQEEFAFPPGLHRQSLCMLNAHLAPSSHSFDMLNAGGSGRWPVTGRSSRFVEVLNMSTDDFSRRNFLRNSAAGAAVALGPSWLPALGATAKVNVGWIGVGSRGNYLMDMFYTGGAAENASVVAICDAYKGYQQRAKDYVMSKENKEPKIYADYRELLADPSIDAVVVATPEHLHYAMAMAAI